MAELRSIGGLLTTLFVLGGSACSEPEAAVAVAEIQPPTLPPSDSAAVVPARAEPPPKRRCPADMVDVAGEFCIDRFESSLHEPGSGRRVSPYYHPTNELGRRDRRLWKSKAKTTGSWEARQIPLPELPGWQVSGDFAIESRSVRGVTPNAYLDREVALKACRAVGKRLCKREEWVRACRGEPARRYPYGEKYDPRQCNVSGPQHPAMLLHSAGELGPLDPRMNLVEYRGKRMLEPTGSREVCKTEWGDDAVYDMVGNLDEWVDDPSGTFVGGFYARDTHWGCDMRVEIHTPDYYDYSIGARCCR